MKQNLDHQIETDHGSWGIQGFLLVFCVIDLIIGVYRPVLRTGIPGISEINIVIYILFFMAIYRVIIKGKNISIHGHDYIKSGVEAIQKRHILDSVLSVPYFPNVEIGWDDTPRFPHKGKEYITFYNKSPESFAAFLQKAKEYTDKHPEQPKLITLNAWNEWVEGSCLLPDMKYGFSYLEEVKKVISGMYDPYSK